MRCWTTCGAAWRPFAGPPSYPGDSQGGKARLSDKLPSVAIDCGYNGPIGGVHHRRGTLNPDATPAKQRDRRVAVNIKLLLLLVVFLGVGLLLGRIYGLRVALAATIAIGVFVAWFPCGITKTGQNYKLQEALGLVSLERPPGRGRSVRDGLPSRLHHRGGTCIVKGKGVVALGSRNRIRKAPDVGQGALSR